MPLRPRCPHALAAALLAALAGGCSAGREDRAAVPQPVTVTAPAPAPAVAQEAASADAERRQAGAAARRSSAQRRAARTRREAAARRERERAAQREENRRDEEAPAAIAPEVDPEPPAPAGPPPPRAISERAPVRGPEAAPRLPPREAQARAVVVRFHHLLDAREPLACELLTPRFLEESYGADPAAALEHCREVVRSIDTRVEVAVERSGVRGRRAWVQVVSTTGATSRQTLHLVRGAGEWRIDDATAGPPA